VDIQLLIDSIVRQTTVLVAQLATSGGARAPLAHIANQVFLELARELNAQGLSRKVTADMFGMALRAYRRKIQRLTESLTERGRSLSQAVLDFVTQKGLATRAEVLCRFHGDEEGLVRAVLHDLCESGLVFKSGSGDSALFRAVTESELSHVEQANGGRVDEFVWVMVYRNGPLGRERLGTLMTSLDEAALDAALARLTAAERIHAEQQASGPVYRASEFVLPLGSASGWEAGVYDHYQAVVRTICSRLRERAPHSGGSTYTYDVWPGHPHEEEAKAMLETFRNLAGDLRRRIEAHNAKAGVPAELTQVVLYCGQSVVEEEGGLGEGLDSERPADED
jgi:hypothetical protein